MFSRTSSATYDDAVVYTITYANTNATSTTLTNGESPYDNISGFQPREHPVQTYRRIATLRAAERQMRENKELHEFLARLKARRPSFFELARPRFVEPPQTPRDALQARFTPVDVSKVHRTRSTRRTGRWRWKNWRD